MKQLSCAARQKSALLLSMFLFGTIGIFVRFIPLPSSFIALVRGAIGTIVLLAVYVFRNTRPSREAIQKNLLLLSLSGAFIGFNWILLFEAYRYTTVAIATLCYYLAPVFVTLASPLILKEKLTGVKLVCVLTALIGMAFVSGVLHVGASGGFSPIGVACGIGAALLYASIILMNKRLVGVSSLDTTVVQLGFAAIVLLPYTLFTVNVTSLTVTVPSALLLITVGIVHTGFAYLLYFFSVQALKAQTVAIFSYVDPIVAILLSALLLMERLDIFGIIGAVLILGATFISEWIDIRRAGSARLM